MKRRAFTLVEMAIVLIVMGIIVGSSTKIFTALSKNAKLTETREHLRVLTLDIEGFAKVHHRLPTRQELEAFHMQSSDSWGKEIIYVAPKALQKSICREKKSDLTHIQEDKQLDNLAFMLISSGPNRNLQTAVSDDEQRVTTAKFSQAIDLNREIIDRVEAFDDLFLSRTLWFLHTQVHCSKEDGV